MLEKSDSQILQSRRLSERNKIASRSRLLANSFAQPPTATQRLQRLLHQPSGGSRNGGSQPQTVQCSPVTFLHEKPNTQLAPEESAEIPEEGGPQDVKEQFRRLLVSKANINIIRTPWT